MTSSDVVTIEYYKEKPTAIGVFQAAAFVDELTSSIPSGNVCYHDVSRDSHTFLTVIHENIRMMIVTTTSEEHI